MVTFSIASRSDMPSFMQQVMTFASEYAGPATLNCWRSELMMSGKKPCAQERSATRQEKLKPPKPTSNSTPRLLAPCTTGRILAVLVEDAALVAVIDVSDDVARFRHPVDLIGRLIAGLQLVFADMGVKRQVEDLRETLADLVWPIAVAAERADLDVPQQARMRLVEIDPIGDRDVGQRADIGFDEVQPEDSQRPDVRTGIKRGLGPAFEQREEFVERADAGPAGLDIGRHALADADAIGIGKAEGSIDVNVNVDPARREITAREIESLDIGWKTGDRPDLAILECDVLDAIDALTRVDDMGALEQDGTG